MVWESRWLLALHNSQQQGNVRLNSCVSRQIDAFSSVGPIRAILKKGNSDRPSCSSPSSWLSSLCAEFWPFGRLKVLLTASGQEKNYLCMTYKSLHLLLSPSLSLSLFLCALSRSPQPKHTRCHLVSLLSCFLSLRRTPSHQQPN